MVSASKIKFIIVLSAICYNCLGQFSLSPSSQTKKVKSIGVTHSNSELLQNGYVLLCPSNYTKTFLINNEGKLINQWSSSYLPGPTAYLMDDGSLIRSCKTNNTTFKFGGIGGKLEKRNWNDSLIWEWELNDTNKCLHHDIKPLPNGNILVIAVERKYAADVLLVGRDTSKLSDKELWSESIIEIKPKGKNEAIIVWQWNAWEHLTQNKYSDLANYSKSIKPELIDINYNLELNSSADFLHFNSIDYNPQNNQILVSVRNYNEIWIIDHSTTASQAKNHKGGKSNMGGDLIYRWGNPTAYGLNEKEQLEGQHSASWIKKGYINEGSITLFDNRATTRHSRLLIISPSFNRKTNLYEAKNNVYLPNIETWSYTQAALSEGRGGGLQGLPNGNILFCETSKGRLTEITTNKDTAWMYTIPISSEGALIQSYDENKNLGGMFNANKYASTFIGFKGKNLIPGNTLELNPNVEFGRIEINKSLDTLKTYTLYLSLSNCYLNINQTTLLYNHPISVYNSVGELIDRQTITTGGRWHLGTYKEGVYYFECKSRLTKVIILK